MNGHQVIRPRGVLGRARKVPAWATDDVFIRGMLLGAFPKLAANLPQRRGAGRWMRVIQLYFRSKKTSRETAEEMAEGETVIRRVIERIRLASKGLRDSGKPYGSKRGRPWPAQTNSRS